MKDIYGNILYRISRLPVNFDKLPISAKTAFMSAWLGQSNSDALNLTELRNIFRSQPFIDLRNRRIHEIELLCGEVISQLRNYKDSIWAEIDVEVASLVAFLTNGIAYNLQLFCMNNLPYYVINSLQVLLLEISEYNLFDPLYTFIENETEITGTNDFDEQVPYFTRGQKVVRRNDLNVELGAAVAEGTVTAVDAHQVSVQWSSDEPVETFQMRVTMDILPLPSDQTLTKLINIYDEFIPPKNNPIQIFLAFSGIVTS